MVIPDKLEPNLEILFDKYSLLMVQALRFYSNSENHLWSIKYSPLPDRTG